MLRASQLLRRIREHLGHTHGREASPNDLPPISILVNEATTFAPPTELEKVASASLTILQAIKEVKENKKAYERLGDDLNKLITAILCSYKKREFSKEWLSTDIREILEDLAHTLEKIYSLVQNHMLKNKAIRVISSRLRSDTKKIGEYREYLNYAMQKFELQSKSHQLSVQIPHRNEEDTQESTQHEIRDPEIVKEIHEEPKDLERAKKDQLSEQILNWRYSMKNIEREDKGRRMAEKLQEEEHKRLKIDQLSEKTLHRNEDDIKPVLEIKREARDWEITDKLHEEGAEELERLNQDEGVLLADQQWHSDELKKIEKENRQSKLEYLRATADITNRLKKVREQIAELGRNRRATMEVQSKGSDRDEAEREAEWEADAVEEVGRSVRSSKFKRNSVKSRVSLRPAAEYSTEDDDDDDYLPSSGRARMPRTSLPVEPEDDEFMWNSEDYTPTVPKTRSNRRPQSLQSSTTRNRSNIQPLIWPYVYGVGVPSIINSGVGNITNSNISNVGNDNSRVYRGFFSS